MTTRAIVPNGDGEGSLGTSTAKWGAVYSSDPASGENSGQVPTTAWVQKLVADALAKQKAAYEQAISKAVSDAHPVGSIYTSLTDSRNPNAILGFGTWEALPAGYTLIAQGSGTDDYGSFTYTAGQKYGERKHPLTTDEMPSHHHQYDRKPKSFSNTKLYDDGPQSNCIQSAQKASNDEIASTLDSGGNIPHNNIQPSIAAYCWRRTA
ncbi:phage baseplate protein [Acidaminococcus intestini]|uniref:phage baseplate protein n=1 Tax=Acidaminococcus intestini TaxID=187327 RepID=UPI002050CE02|nr:hypothetical protein [Acidaminococcus intestini]DAS26471.1 MAG TPA: Baseplate structural protein [Caudoviricetes sp.]